MRPLCLEKAKDFKSSYSTYIQFLYLQKVGKPNTVASNLFSHSLNLDTLKIFHCILESKTLTKTLLSVYVILLIWIIVFKFGIQITYSPEAQLVNWIPYGQPLILNGKVNHQESILNILIFIPLGLYLGMLFKNWNFFKILSISFLCSLVLECSQYLLEIGSFDITDLINNTLGSGIGMGISRALEKLLGSHIRARKVLNIIALVGTLSILGLLLFLKINRLYMFRM